MAGSTTINRGNVALTILVQIPLTPGSTATITSAEQTFTVPGLQIGDQISNVTYLGANSTLVDISNARVSAANVLSLTFQNNTAGTLTYPAGNFLLEINRPESLPLAASLG